MAKMQGGARVKFIFPRSVLTLHFISHQKPPISRPIRLKPFKSYEIGKIESPNF